MNKVCDKYFQIHRLKKQAALQHFKTLQLLDHVDKQAAKLQQGYGKGHILNVCEVLYKRNMPVVTPSLA